MFRFLHAADIHLDSPLVGLERYEGAPVEQIRQATRRAFENLVQLAIDEKVAFVLIAGDLYDGSWRDYSTGLYFTRETARLKDANIPVLVIAGNHDAANKMTKVLRFNKNVRMLSADKPETVCIDDFDVAIHGQGFAREAVLEDLSANYPSPEPGCFNIGILHTCASVNSDHERYAPCTVDGLCSKGYDYWALGHVHQRQILNRNPHVVFSGNVQGRHIREEGEKGCYMVSVDGNHKVASVDFRPLDVFRWQRCEVDVSGAVNGDAVLERVQAMLGELLSESDGLPVAARVEIQGATRAHGALHNNPAKWINEIRSAGLEIGGELIWIEKVKLRTLPPAAELSAETDGPLGEVRAVLEEMRSNEELLGPLREELTVLAGKLPGELKDRDEGIDPTCTDWLRELLDQVEPLLRSRLLAGEDAP